MAWENALLMEFSNDVEKYEIEVTKTSQNNSLFSQWMVDGKHVCPFRYPHLVMQSIW